MRMATLCRLSCEPMNIEKFAASEAYDDIVQLTPGGMEHLGVADQAVDVRFGEEVRRRRDQQDIGAFDVEREFDVHAGLVLDVFLEAFQRVAQGRFRQAEVVADLLQLADDFVRVPLARGRPGP